MAHIVVVETCLCCAACGHVEQIVDDAPTGAVAPCSACGAPVTSSNTVVSRIIVAARTVKPKHRS